MQMSIETINVLQAEDREALYDHCGIVGMLCSEEEPLFGMGLKVLAQLQTRGYDGAGFTALRDDNTVLLHKQQGTIGEVFAPGTSDYLSDAPYNNAQYQTRYGTRGEFSQEGVQPYMIRHYKTGEIFMVSHNGEFSRIPGDTYDYRSDTAQFVERLANSEGDTWDDRIKNTLVDQKGAWSLIIGTKDTMYLARDPLGIRPLYFSQGETESGNYVSLAASETIALEQAGFSEHLEVLPGQLIKFDRATRGFSVTTLQECTRSAHCIFENVYTLDENGKALLHRNSMNEVSDSMTVAEVRRRSGERLALEAPLTSDEVDIVIGIPGTAITGGIAYAQALGLEYVQAIKDKNTSESEQRTFMQSDIEGILKKVLNHFDFEEDALRGKRVCLVDDSLVRGNVSEGLAKLLKEFYGVVEVHFRILSPPIIRRCYLGVNTRSQSELIAARFKKIARNYEEHIQLICKKIGADSLAYLSPEGLRYAVANDENSKDFCMGCMLGGKYPVDEYGIALN